METHSTDTSTRADTPVIPSPALPPKVKLMYSYGGRIQPRSHNHRLTYAGGHTKIITVDRSISYSSILTKLSSLCDIPGGVGPNNLAIKYQLPGEDLDALVSIFDDDDLDHMMVEYDRLCSVDPAKTPRLRLFLFPLGSYNKLPSLSTSDSDDSNNSKSSNGWFVHGINYASRTKPVNPDYLCGFDKNISGISNSDKTPDPQISSDINPSMVQEKTTSSEISAAISVPANFPGVQVPASGGCYTVANSVAGSGNNEPVYYIPVHGGQGFYGVHQQVMQQPTNVGFCETGLGHVGYDAAGKQRQVFYAVAVEGRQGGGGGGAEGVEGNVPNVNPQTQTSIA